MIYEQERGEVMPAMREGDAQRKLREARSRGINPPVQVGGFAVEGSHVSLQLNVNKGTTLFEVLPPVKVDTDGRSLHNAVLEGFQQGLPDLAALGRISHAFELNTPDEDVTALQFTARKEVQNANGEVELVPYNFTSVATGTNREERVAKAVEEAVQGFVM